MIRYFKEDTTFSPKKKRLIGKWLREVARGRGYGIGDLNYIFCSDPYLLAINRQFLDHDYYTDIITFDYDEGDTINGDIVISLDTVRSNAEQLGKDYDEELHRVIIHGILHLCGQNDKGPGEREQMEAAENKALNIK